MRPISHVEGDRLIVSKITVALEREPRHEIVAVKMAELRDSTLLAQSKANY